MDVLARAAAIAGSCGLGPVSLTPVLGSGVTNHVVVARPAGAHAAAGEPAVAGGAAAAGATVIRFAAVPPRPGWVQVEAWCLQRAAAAGVPSPRVVAVGELDGTPYLVQSFVDGRPGRTARSPALWRTLGGYAVAVASVPLDDAPAALFPRFGRDLPAAWRAHVAYNVGELTGDDPLLGLGVRTAAGSGRLRERIGALAEVPLRHGLVHGDIGADNVLVPSGWPGSGGPVLLDWGNASAGPVPYAELVDMARKCRLRGDPTEDEVAAFADGCGLVLSDVRPLLDDLVLLASLDLVRWALAWRPELVDDYARQARAFTD